MDVKELPSDMGETGNFLDLAAPIEILEPGIAVGMQPTCEVFEMFPRPAALAIRSELVECGGMIVACPIPLVSQIDPQPPGLGLTDSRCQDIDRRIVGVDGRMT